MAERKKTASSHGAEHKMAEVHVHHHHHHHMHGASRMTKSEEKKGGRDASREEKRTRGGEFEGKRR